MKQQRKKKQQNKSTITNYWSSNKDTSVISNKRKLDPLITPLKSGRIVSYDMFCENSRIKQRDLGIPNIIDQWFSIEFIQKNDNCIQYLSHWSSSSTCLYPFTTPSYYLLNEEDITDKIEEDDLCSLLAIMDHLDENINMKEDLEPCKKRISYIPYCTSVIITDQSNQRKHKLCAQCNYYIPKPIPLFLHNNINNKNKVSIVSLLKSALQKNVRRCNAESAVRIALKLIILDFPQFIRRLSIIILEDAILHPGLPLIIWLMITSVHGYNVPYDIINIILQIVYDIASIKYRDPLINEDIKLSIPSFVELNNILRNKQEEFILIRSLLTRGSYGGMNGDIIMMQKYASLWLERFQFPSIYPLPFSQDIDKVKLHYLENNRSSSIWCDFIYEQYYKITSKNTIEYSKIQLITKDDIPLASVDFHCTPIIEHILNNIDYNNIKLELEDILEINNITKSDIIKQLKSLMWTYRSSITYKKQLFKNNKSNKLNEKEEKLKKLFNKLEAKFDEYSQKYINNII